MGAVSRQRRSQAEAACVAALLADGAVLAVRLRRSRSPVDVFAIYPGGWVRLVRVNSPGRRDHGNGEAAKGELMALAAAVGDREWWPGASPPGAWVERWTYRRATLTVERAFWRQAAWEKVLTTAVDNSGEGMVEW
jgi:hypothetical protein